MISALLDAFKYTSAITVDYFLKWADTPGWIWLFRILGGGGLALTLAVYFYYAKKKGK